MPNRASLSQQLDFDPPVKRWNQNLLASCAPPPTPSKNGRWVFQKASAEPTFFPLVPVVRSKTVIMCTPHIVAVRLCDSFRLRSIEAKYNESQAICKTRKSNLTYSINLYDDKEQEGNTIMEVIRINGCGFAFRREREVVIASAQGKGGVPSPLSNLPAMSKVPEAFLLQNFKPPSKREHEDTIMYASNRLHSNKYDAQLFVLRNLSAITSSNKVNQESAQIISELIMKNSFHIQERLVSILASSCLPLEDNNEDHVQTMVNACLSLFSNVLSLLSNLELLENFLIEYENNDDFVNSIIPRFKL